MKTASNFILAAALTLTGAIPIWSAAADSRDQGPPTPEQREQMRERCKSDPEKCRAEMKQRAEAWWKKVDTNGDGKISRDEANANAPHLAKNFDKIDTDHDGTISREELHAAREAMHERRREGGPGQPKPQ